MRTRAREDLDEATLAVRIPMRFEPRGGRKRIIGPDGEPVVADLAMPPQVDDAIVRALAKAWRWKRMLEGGAYASIGELAAAEKVNFSYLCKVLRLSLLPPETVEEILDGGQQKSLTLEYLLNHHLLLQTSMTKKISIAQIKR
jgi:hypothetical protein